MIREMFSLATRALNVLLGGSADWHTSARAWRDRDRPFWGFMRRLIDALFWPFERDHCRGEYEDKIASARADLAKHDALTVADPPP